MPAAQTVNDDEGGDAPPRLELAKPVKKLCLVAISFLPAYAILSITNVVLAHLLLAFQLLRGPNAVRRESGVATRTVYVPPTQDDLERLRQELEKSEPLPPIAADAQRSAAQVQALLASTGALLKERDETLEAVKGDIDELSEAFASFEERLEQDTRRDAPSDAPSSEETAMLLKQHVPSLVSLMGQTTLMHMERDELTDTITLAMEEVQLFLSGELSADDPKRALFLNANNTLLAALTGKKAGKEDATTSTCQSYLALDPRKAVRELNTKDAKGVCGDTARESDFYKLVENIKHILSRRDLSSSDKSESIPSPVEEDGVKVIRAQISPMVDTVATRWERALAQEQQMREYWVGRTKTLAASSGSGDEGGLCASPDLVEDMVTSGLEAVRTKADLRSTLVGSALGSLAEEPKVAQLLSEEMEKASIPDIDYESGNGRATPPLSSSSWKVGRKSFSYMADGPLLRRGVAGWIDTFVDAISGYNDNVDALIDWAVGDDGESVGTSVVGTISRVLQKIPFPTAQLPRLKKSGILAGRARAVMEQ
ncbi:hypothetical protein ACHAXT_004489 [Thalassiosira profunda]